MAQHKIIMTGFCNSYLVFLAGSRELFLASPRYANEILQADNEAVKNGKQACPDVALLEEDEFESVIERHGLMR